jgi:hypothetical protein
MNRRIRVIDEANYSVLGTFDSEDEAIDFVATLLSVNDEDYLDELTIADETRTVLFGDSLRDALRRRKEASEREAQRRNSGGQGGYVQPVEALAAKGYPH